MSKTSRLFFIATLTTFLCSCGGGGSSGGGGAPATGTSSPPADPVPLASVSSNGTLAWIGATDTQLIFPVSLAGSTLYRASEPDCDALNIEACLNGQQDTVSGEVITDTTLSHTSGSAFFQLYKNNAFEAELELSQKEPPLRSDHQTVFFQDRLWIVGGQDSLGATTNYKNDVWSSVDGISWNLVNASAAFSARANHQVVSYSGKLWLIGGRDENGLLDDVWTSDNGSDWIEVNITSGFGLREKHQTSVFNGKLWIIAGQSEIQNPSGGTIKAALNDAWHSIDGAQWVKVMQTNSFPTRHSHQTVVFNNDIWVVGGLKGVYTVSNDVWHSSDGANWQEALTSNTKFSARKDHQLLAQGGKLWLSGGFSEEVESDIWTSSDGIDWALESTPELPSRHGHQLNYLDDQFIISGGKDGVNNAYLGLISTDGISWRSALPENGFSPRDDAQTVEFKGRMWIIGGNTAALTKTSEIYSSDDGINWILETATPGFSARSGHQAVVFQNKIWVIGGFAAAGSGSARSNDVWSSPDGITWTEVSDYPIFERRYDHQVVVFNGAMWVIGGDFTPLHPSGGQVWKSSNGANWTAVSTRDSDGVPLPFGYREQHKAIVHANRIWLYGGDSGFGNPGGHYDHKDIWSSENGVTWRKDADNVAFNIRRGHGMAVFNNKLWLIAGNSKNLEEASTYDTPRNDVWSSIDGVTWEEEVASFQAPFGLVSGHQVLSFKGNLWQVAGYGPHVRGYRFGRKINHIWRSENGTNWRQGKKLVGID